MRLKLSGQGVEKGRGMWTTEGKNETESGKLRWNRLESTSTFRRLHLIRKHHLAQELEKLTQKVRLLSCAKRGAKSWATASALQQPPNHREVWLCLCVYLPNPIKNFSWTYTNLEPFREEILGSFVSAWLNWCSKNSTTSMFTLWYADVCATEKGCKQQFLLPSLQPFIFPRKSRVSGNIVGELDCRHEYSKMFIKSLCIGEKKLLYFSHDSL